MLRSPGIHLTAEQLFSLELWVEAKKVLASVSMILASVRVLTLSLVFRQSHLPANDEGDNEILLQP